MATEKESIAFPWAGIVVGGLGIAAGLAGNVFVLLLGLAGFILGILGVVNHQRNLGIWALVLGGVALLGYVGIITAQQPRA